ncbi:4Fe-4S dicluster domain-containing protein [Desulfospira joergensenii]|uniref:4Fe-4S dicluster domain-containing protein n=1 Tax=Desulfospira joergensenii TaxID=53329 RepID=UPI0003B62C95|nr:4Fe-4S dicluster domain-containing protein [Desulfospira joergensenii]
MSYSFFVDTSRCTACRGCQIACKEWYELPANKTRQTGSHQNPPDLNVNNYKLVRFSEHLEGEKIRWNFFPDQCRHCIDPPCVYIGQNYEDDAVFQDTKTGAVVYTDKTRKIPKDGFDSMREACPYDIPRRDPATGRISKCSMCYDRLVRGLKPVCVDVCPTGTMNFGERSQMLTLAEERLARVKKDHPKTILADVEDVNVIYLLTDLPENYHEYSVAQGSSGLNRHQFLAGIAAPFKRAGKVLSKSV